MKYLTDIIREREEALFKEYGVFFAFNKKQLIEGMKKIGCRKKEELCTILEGKAIIRKDRAKTFIKKYKDLIKKGIKEDIEMHGIDKIIERELYNYECFYQGDWTDAYEALKDYGITKKMVKNKYTEILREKLLNNAKKG